MKLVRRAGNAKSRAEKIAISITVEAAKTSVDKIYADACKELDNNLNKMFKQIAINSAICLGINVAGMIVAGTRFLGEVPSRIVASVIFAGAMCFTWVKFFVSFKENKDYWEMIWDCSKEVFKTRSLSLGIQAYVYQKKPFIKFLFVDGIPFADVFIPGLKKVIPDVAGIVKRIRRDFWKKCVLFCSLFGIYFVCVYVVLKPILLGNFIHMNQFQLFFFPLIYLVRSIAALF